MKNTDAAQKFLRALGRGELAALLEHASYSVYMDDPSDWISTTHLVLHAPEPYAEAVKGLSDIDKNRVKEAIEKTDPDAAGASSLSAETDTDRELEPEQRLFGELVVERNMLIGVATGGSRIQEVDDYYQARRRRVHALLVAAGHEDPNPFESLWDWYRRYKADGGGYKDRRSTVYAMYRPLLQKLSGRPVAPVPARKPTGWVRVDRTLDKARGALERATREEDFQGVGLLCREVLISLAQAVFDSSKHQSLDAVKVSDTDAKRMLEGYFAAELAGAEFEATRKHARASLDLAVTLQHKRTADFRFAALCLESTSSVVNTVAIISGRRGMAHAQF